ncbi:MAG: peptide chain release factor N(5)-glutamine methyltransferase [Bacteroidia bacterium]|nr:peptide chain release factor N(5)-glutamine methyltransferase [Bacteroidia bacterium]
MTIKEFKKSAISELSNFYPTKEAQNITILALQETLKLNSIELFMQEDNELYEDSYEKMRNIVNRLSHYEPLHYILGYAYFRGKKYIVNEHVLIPRPETEELVEWVIDENKNLEVEILDVGCGSGCIAISLDLEIPLAVVCGVDISKEAVYISNKNSEDLNSSAIFKIADFRDEEHDLEEGFYDIIVSNPPYILKEESVVMSKSTITFEPKRALFTESVTETYYELAIFAKKYLRSSGCLYLEINEFHLKDISDSLLKAGFQKLFTKKDLSGKIRMLKASL